MPTIRIKSSRRISAPADRVYRCIADYRTHHPAFLPPAFSNFTVEEGGVGAGTVIHFTLTAGGRDPAPIPAVGRSASGRALTETTIGTQNSTTFSVIPDGSGSNVTIRTEYEGSRGVSGMIERFLAPLLLGRLYKDELQRLDTYTQTNPI